MTERRQKQIVTHTVFWLGYLSFKVYHEYLWTLSQYDELTPAQVFESALIAQSGILPVKMLFSYWLVYWLLPRTSQNFIKWFYILPAFGITIILHRLAVVHLIIPLAYDQIPEVQQLFSLERITSATVDISMVAGIAAMLVLYSSNKAEKERASQLEKEKVVAELQFLKNQTNPHFLFNTLNNLYGLARKQSKKTPEAILQLSRFMRFVLYDANKPTITLQEEVQMIDNYISLEKLRFGQRIKVSFGYPEGLSGHLISPLILLPLVENAFKHGASELEEEGLINIRLAINGQLLNFEVENTIRASEQEHQDGIGLSNLKRQLDLQYPSHQLESGYQGNLYKASLHINLSENE
jgi:LytS/YehU family sensor histidine kinase